MRTMGEVSSVFCFFILFHVGLSAGKTTSKSAQYDVDLLLQISLWTTVELLRKPSAAITQYEHTQGLQLSLTLAFAAEY